MDLQVPSEFELRLREEYQVAAADVVVAPLLPSFLASFSKNFEAFTATVASRDYNAAKRIAHRIKGSAALYGFASVFEVFEKLDQELAKLPNAHAADIPDLSQVRFLIEDLAKIRAH